MCWKTAVRAPLSWTIQIGTEWPIISAALGKIGARVLGLNWRLTAPETRYVLENSGARAIILDDPDPTALAEAFAGLDFKLKVSLDKDAEGFLPYGSLLEE